MLAKAITLEGNVEQPERIEFGRVRTVCNCEQCIGYCQFMPGMLIPSDLSRLIPPGASPYDWAELYLRASAGARAIAVVDGSVQFVTVGTLVPADRPDGSCHWLTPDGRCSVHAVSPFGCAFFSHANGPEPDEFSKQGVQSILEAWADPGSLYRQLWLYLDSIGLDTPGPAAKRARARNFNHAAQKAFAKP